MYRIKLIRFWCLLFPHHNKELPEKVQMVIQFQRQHTLSAMVLRLRRNLTYSDWL